MLDATAELVGPRLAEILGCSAKQVWALRRRHGLAATQRLRRPPA